MKKKLIGLTLGLFVCVGISSNVFAHNRREIGPYDTILTKIGDSTLHSNIFEEDRLGDMELLVHLVQAEAGNQDLIGMRLVVSTVLNRLKSEKFPNSIYEIVYQKGQFEVVQNGMLDKVAWDLTDQAFEAVRLEFEEGQINNQILYFSTKPHNFIPNHFKHQDHWFGW